MIRKECVVSGYPADDSHHLRVSGDGIGRKPAATRCIPVTRTIHTLFHNGGISLREQFLYLVFHQHPPRRDDVEWIASQLDKSDVVRRIKENYGR